MCLSANVSFAASVFLVGGTAISIVAWRRNKRYFPLALMPLFAGLQQFAEGFVWVGMNGNDPLTVLWGAMGFIFFTWFMWPIWVPFSVYVLEPDDSPRKRLFLILAGIGLAFGLLLYIPHGLNSDMVVVEVNNQSLAYEKSMWLDFMMPRWLTNHRAASLVALQTCTPLRADAGGSCRRRHPVPEIRLYLVLLPAGRSGDAASGLCHSDQQMRP